MAGEERTARVEMNGWEMNGIWQTGWQSKAADRVSKNNWQRRQLVEAVSNDLGWQGMAGGKWCEHQGQKHCSSNVHCCPNATDKQQSTGLNKSLNTCFSSKMKPTPRWTLLTGVCSNWFMSWTPVAAVQHQGNQLSNLCDHVVLHWYTWSIGSVCAWVWYLPCLEHSIWEGNNCLEQKQVVSLMRGL